MGYSNVAGALNVFTSTSTQDLVVRGDTTHTGNITAVKGYAAFGNVAVANLVVTGNFTITATNTQTTNALTINNAGTATALKVVQFEGGGPGHSYNVAEFWDFQTLAMVIDPEGNVGIHTASSPGYALTVSNGALIDSVTSQLFMGNGSGLSNLQTTSLVGPVTALQLAAAQTNVTQVGTLTSLNVSGTANIFTGWFTTANVTGGLGANTAFFNLLKTNTSNTGFLNAANGAVSNLLCSNINVLTTANLASLFVGGVYGNGSGISNLNSSNLVGNVASANLALVVSQPSQPNVTSLGTLTSLTVSGVLQAGLFTGNASGLSNVNGSNVSTVPTAQSVTVAAQTNITSVGTLTGLTVSGVLNANLHVGNASGLSNINSSNLVGNVAQANIALVVSQPSQPNITSVGTLTSLSVQGISSANLFVGNASAMSNLNSSNLVGNVAQANIALVVSQPLQGNITRTGTLTGLNVTGVSNLTDIYANGFTSNSTNTVFNFDTLTVPFLSSTTLNVSTVSNIGIIFGQGNGISNVQSSVLSGNVANANVALVVSQPAQPNITSVGQLTSLTVSGISSSNLFVGNASALSNINGANVSTVPTAQSVTVAAQTNITSVGTLTSLSVQGISSSNLFVGNASGISNINSSNLVGNVANSNVALVVSQPFQPNITSVGTMTGLYSSGNITATFFTGQGNGLTNVLSSVLVGNVANANVALVVSQPSQPNITSVGTLTGLTVQGILNANLHVGNASALSNINGANVSTVPAAQSVTVAAQTNITSVGTLTSLTVQGISSSNLFVGNASALSNLNASNVAFGALTASQLAAAQTNITSVGTLTSLTVSGNSNLQTLNVASISTPGVIPVSSGLFMNLNATYTLNSTGNWTGNIAGSVTSNLFTLFAPNPIASWTTYGTNPLITGPTSNGGFRFSQTGPYQFTVVLTSDNNIKTIALSSNTSDVHSNLADPGVWLYCYRISVGQDPSVPVQIPFYVDSTSKYYFIDYESVRKTGENIHKTAYTNVTAEGYTGSYVILKPV